ncbi:MAG: O-antigen ligase family protein [Deinococcota bacterium]
MTHIKTVCAVVSSLLFVWLVLALGEPIFLRFEIPLWQVGLASALTLLSLVYLRTLPWSLLAWLALSFGSIAWSLSPAASLRASMWHAVYVAVFLTGMAFPRYVLAGLVVSHTLILARGLDLFIVTQRDDFNGVWYQQNVQGSQLLLIAPLLVHWTAIPSRWSVYLAIPLGFIVFLSGLTFSAASQILLVLGVVVVWIWRWQALAGKRWEILFLFIVGMGLAWLVIQPQSAQIFTVNLGKPQVGTRVSDPVNTLLARVHLIEDISRRALEALPLGTGIGSLQDIYSHLQRHEIESVDAHNYYLQTFLTLGIFGILLLLTFFWNSLRAAFLVSEIGISIALGLFMGYLAFDIMAYIPGIMVLFFALMGVARGLLQYQRPSSVSSSATKHTVKRSLKVGFAVCFMALPIFWWWWSQPCDDITCFAGRKLADPLVMRVNEPRLSPEQTLRWAAIGKTRYPETLAYAINYADAVDALALTANERTRALALYRDIARRFPRADLGVYRDWRDAAIRAGDVAEAQQAIRDSYRYYGGTLLLTGF